MRSIEFAPLAGALLIAPTFAQAQVVIVDPTLVPETYVATPVAPAPLAPPAVIVAHQPWKTPNRSLWQMG